MKITRRQFLKYSAITGAAAIVPWKMALREAYAQYGVNSPNLTKFVDLIRGVGPGGIHVATPDATLAPVTGVTHYTIDIGPFNDVLHSDFTTFGKPAFIPGFLGTKLWGFNPTKALGVVGPPTPIHLSGIIVAQKNVPVQITFNNNLPSGLNANIIPNDDTIPLPAGPPRWDRVAVHLHGGFVPWISDGGPHDWWAPDGSSGLSFLNNTVLNPGAAPNQGEYYYPNNQSARLVWYHDHAFGQTRTNAYAGIASAYVIVDPVAETLFDAANPGVPSALNLANLNNTFFYLVFQDKVFFGPAGPAANYKANAGPGDLFYANIYDPLLFGPAGIPSFGGPLLTPFPFPSVVPEFFGDTILANGTAYPVLDVEPRPVRIRMLNACNSRFLNPRLVRTAGLTFPDNTEPKVNALGPGFIQIGTEGGYLPAPAPVSGKGAPLLLIAPAERADLIVDFTAFAGQEFILYNDAPGPFPGGAAIFDYYPKNPKTPTSIPGFGPNTRTLLKIRVKTTATGTVTPLPAAITLGQVGLSDPPLVAQTPGVPTPIPTSVTVGGVAYPVTVKTLTLNEGFDEYGRLAQFIGTDTAPIGVTPGFFGRRYLDLATEAPNVGTVEVWQIANLTADTHPIHFHLVNVQILYRQPIKIKGAVGTFIINPNGQPIAPDLNELGYKETVRMNPGEVTTVIMKFDLPVVPFTVPPSTRDVGGNEYVWHCHILEHEEHDMMRPLFVQGTNPVSDLAVTPASITVPTTGGTATYTVSGGVAPYDITSSSTDPNITFPATLVAAGSFTVTVAATTAKTVTLTVVDSLGIPKTAQLAIA